MFEDIYIHFRLHFWNLIVIELDTKVMGFVSESVPTLSHVQWCEVDSAWIEGGLLLG
jgi:hypothetical protein